MILLLDNHDSYTFHLYSRIEEGAGKLPVGGRAEFSERENLAQRVRDGEFSHVVISPGPGTPENPRDFAAACQVIEAARDIPVLGICLGHQGLALLNVARVKPAPEPKHGFISTVHHTGTGLFAGIPQDFKVVRYHSLCVDDIDSTLIRPLAWSEDGVLMGLEVLGRPHWAVQSDQESSLTEHGRSIGGNFLTQDVPAQWKLTHREDTLTTHCAATFARLKDAPRDAFWLDSATADTGAGCYSILGTNTGSQSASIRYDISRGNVQVARGGEITTVETDVLSYLQQLLAETVDTEDLPEL